MLCLGVGSSCLGFSAFLGLVMSIPFTNSGKFSVIIFSNRSPTSPRLCEYLVLDGKRDLADIIKLRILR